METALGGVLGFSRAPGPGDRRLDACLGAGGRAPRCAGALIVAFGPRAYGSGIGHPAPVQTIRLWIDGEMGEFAMM